MQRLNSFECLYCLFKGIAVPILFCFPLQISAQQQITGRVLGEGGQLLPDITVATNPAGSAASTDSLGRFTLPVIGNNKKIVLLFSAIGYRSIRRIVDLDSIQPTGIEIQLHRDILNLDEVVVTGVLLETPRKKLGNSISTISASQLEHTGASHLSGMMAGKILGGVITQNSGDPAGGFSLKLRGVSSLYGSSEPLYLLDGVVIDNRSVNLVNLLLNSARLQNRLEVGTNRLVDINPHDIDHIEVINGPAAAAVYGSRAANGVVQLFSKKGKKGQPTVTYTASVNFNAVARKLDINDYPFRFGVRKTAGLSAPDESRTTIVNRRMDPALAFGPVGSNGKKLDTTRYPVQRYDYQDAVLQSAWGTDQHLSVSNAWDKGNLYAAVSYLKNNGIVVGTDFQRYGVKFRADYIFNSFLKVSGGLAYNNSRTNEKLNSSLQFSTLAAINHIDNVYDIYKRDNQGKLTGVEYGWVNPISTLDGHKLGTENNRTIADISIRATPWKGFVFSGSIGLDTYDQQGFTFLDRLPYYGNGNVGLNLFPDGYVSNVSMNYRQWTGDISMAYSAKISPGFTSSTVAGYAGQYFQQVFQSQEGRDLLPFVRNINAAQNLFNAAVDDRSEQSVYGLYVQETIGFKELAFLTVAGRFDGSSAFGSDAGRIFYPKASLAFQVSDLKFWQNTTIHTWFNTLKLRMAYGKAGNLTGIGPYDRFSNYPPVNYYAGGIVPLNRQGNESIKPEVKTEWEFGTDLQFFNGRLFSRFNFYTQKINDLVIVYNWAPSNGSSAVLANIGEMVNKGIEFQIGGTLVQQKNFSWEVSAMVSKNRNEVIRTTSNTGFVGLDGQNTQGILPGHPMNLYYAFYYARNEDGSLLLNNNNGFMLPQVERGDPENSKPRRDAQGQPAGTPIRKVLGDPDPDYSASITNELKFKNWRLHLQIDRVAGFEVFNWAAIIRNNIGHGINPERELKGELPRGWSAAVGGFLGGPIIHEEFVEDGTFTRLREISLSYQLKPVKWLKSLECILTGRNLFTSTRYSGYDPETNTAGQGILRGLDYSTNPIPRVVQVTLVTRF